MKKKILFIADRPRWAFEFTIRGVMQHLPGDEYEFEIRYTNDIKFISENHSNWDLIFPIGWKWLPPYDIRTPREKTVSMIQSFRTLRGGSIDQWANYLNGKYCAVGMVNLRLVEMFKDKVDRVFYTPNAVDCKMFTPDYSDNENIVVGWAGRGNDAAFRGIDLIKEAVEACGYELRLLVADEKPLPHKQMPGFYHSLDCYINASESEGCSNTCLEAAACGLPILATATGTIPELVESGKTGYIIERNVPSIVAALKKMSKAQCRWMGVTMRNRILGGWSWPITISKYKALIDYGLKSWEERAKNIATDPEEHVTLIEVGGRNGTTTDLVLAEQPHWDVLIFEPNPEFFWALSRKYDCEKRVRVLQSAAWNDDGEKQFFVGENDNTSSLHKEKKDLVVSKEIAVKCVRLSHFIRGGKGTRILLNINCEGSELEIMEDMMDSGAYRHVKMMIGLHEDTMPNPQRYKMILDRMESLEVDFIPKHYRHLRDEAEELSISMQELLKKREKGNWVEWFSGGKEKTRMAGRELEVGNVKEGG